MRIEVRKRSEARAPEAVKAYLRAASKVVNPIEVLDNVVETSGEVIRDQEPQDRRRSFEPDNRLPFFIHGNYGFKGRGGMDMLIESILKAKGVPEFENK
jgi:hypothetical protein